MAQQRTALTSYGAPPVEVPTIVEPPRSPRVENGRAWSMADSRDRSTNAVRAGVGEAM